MNLVYKNKLWKSKFDFDPKKRINFLFYFWKSICCDMSSNETDTQYIRPHNVNTQRKWMMEKEKKI